MKSEVGSRQIKLQTSYFRLVEKHERPRDQTRDADDDSGSRAVGPAVARRASGGAGGSRGSPARRHALGGKTPPPAAPAYAAPAPPGGLGRTGPLRAPRPGGECDP